MVSRVKDLSGMKFYRLLVLRLDRIDEKRNARWICKCECGAEVSIRGFNLTGGKSKSCGCLQKERASEASRTHGNSGSVEYDIWASMIQRCTNPNIPAFKDYGARGITVCEEWFSFETFLVDMGKRPSKLHSIERSNNDKGYSKENCRWATKAEQARNTRRNRYIDTPNGRMNVTDAAEMFGVKRETILSRLRRGVTAERLLDKVI